MAKKINVFTGIPNSLDGVQPGDLVIEGNKILQMTESGLNQLSPVEPDMDAIKLELRKELAQQLTSFKKEMTQPVSMKVTPKSR